GGPASAGADADADAGGGLGLPGFLGCAIAREVIAAVVTTATAPAMRATRRRGARSRTARHSMPLLADACERSAAARASEPYEPVGRGRNLGGRFAPLQRAIGGDVERLDALGATVQDVEVLAARVEGHVDGTRALAGRHRHAVSDERELAVADAVGRDRRVGRVGGVGELATRCDAEPARRGLAVLDRCAHGGEPTLGATAWSGVEDRVEGVRRDGAGACCPTESLGDDELTGLREGAPERCHARRADGVAAARGTVRAD